MRIRGILPRIFLGCLTLASLLGCSLFRSDPNDALADMTVGMSVSDPVGTLHYQAARGYAAQGRYELAREQYLLSYASTEGDPVLREMLQRELKAVDMMIQVLR